MDFIELIKKQAEDRPENIAVIRGTESICYREFYARINQLTNWLLGQKSSPRVIIDLQQSIQGYAIIIAVLQAGGTYCPMNPDAPTDRKKSMISQFQPNLLIGESLSPELQSGEYNCFTVSEIGEGYSSAPVKIIYNPEDNIYVIFTSGSSGSPKGVMISRKALNHFLDWSIPTYAAGEKDIWGQFSLLSFDLSIVDIFTCLCSGATLCVLADPADKLRPALAIASNKITIWHSIPSAIEFMIRNEVSAGADLSSVRLMSFCGEVLRKHHVEYLFSKNRDIVVFNTYGPTEGTLFCTCQELTFKDHQNYFYHTMSIGRPISGWNFDYIIENGSDEKEVVIYGDYVGIGYIGDVPDSKFKQRELDGHVYRSFETGDLVVEKQGKLYFTSRKDRQIKLKGYRIEPGEIEFWVSELTKRTCIILFHEDALYGFIESANQIDSQALRAQLSMKLEKYKIPVNFISVPVIPRNSNLKPDLKQLIKLLS